MPDYLQISVSTVKDLLQYFTDRSKSADNLRNNILREFRDNLKLLEHRNKAGVNSIALLQKLSVAAIGKAYADNYKFDKLCEGPKQLPASLIMHKAQQKYVGWTATQFIYNIEGRINDLHNLPNLYSDLQTAPINLALRLDNLYYQLLLFGLFISKKS
jgi:hypothetical protein